MLLCRARVCILERMYVKTCVCAGLQAALRAIRAGTRLTVYRAPKVIVILKCMQSFRSLAFHGAENDLSQGSRASHENYKFSDFEGFRFSRALCGLERGFEEFRGI